MRIGEHVHAAHLQQEARVPDPRELGARRVLQALDVRPHERNLPASGRRVGHAVADLLPLPAPEIVKDFEGVLLINAKDSDLLSEIPAPVSNRDHIYLIDPIGNLMMRFPKNPDPAQMAKDIKRLLKVSQLEHAMGTDQKH